MQTTLPAMQAEQPYSCSLHMSLLDAAMRTFIDDNPTITFEMPQPGTVIVTLDVQIGVVESSAELPPDAVLFNAYGDSPLWEYIDMELVLSEIGEHWEGE